MVATLEEIKSATDFVFEDDNGLKEIVVPEPPILMKDKMEAFLEANLTTQYTAALYDMRIWQAKKMGFQEITSDEMVELLMGEKHTGTESGSERQCHEWAYNHHNDKLLGNNWGGKPTHFQNISRRGPWYVPPFLKSLQWTVIFGKLNYLKREIPYWVVLRIEECKKLKLFNVFNVMAPIEAWEKKGDIDPIVVASIWELPYDEHKNDGQPEEAGAVTHFFLAQW